MSVGIVSIAEYVPKEEIANADLTSAGVTDEWIRRKTRIRSRRFAADGEATSDLAAKAGEQALARANLAAEDVDVLIVSTSTPDSPQPPTSYLVQDLLGARHAFAFDVNVVCSGFVYALEVARALIASKPHCRALVVAADLYSRCLDFSDRRTAVLFGDGAGAAVVAAVEDGYGILHAELESRGDQNHLIRVEAGGSRLPASHSTVDSGGHFFKMEGRLVSEFVLAHVPASMAKTVRAAGVEPDEIRHVVSHQPNGILLDELARRSGFVNARFHQTLEHYGNVGSASIPVTLADADRRGDLNDGDLVLLTGFGGGMALGNCLLRWRHAVPGMTMESQLW